MNSSTNTFDKGMSSDVHPIMLPDGTYIDALNVTTVTRNGNEGVIQNDMGNAKIEDAITGNIMGLNSGFIPLGMKEHQGVLYIASYNQDTGEGELGSIPSPKILWDCSTHVCNNINLAGYESSQESSVDYSDLTNITPEIRVDNGFIPLCDKVLKVGDEFMVNLYFNYKNGENENIEETEDTSPSTEDNLPQTKINRYIIEGNNLKIVEENKPLISTIDLQGWYNLKLYSILESGEIYDLTNIITEKQEYYLVGNPQKQKSNYWYIYGKNLDINIEKSRKTNCFKKYPNILPGQLCIKLEFNNIKNVSLLNQGSSKENDEGPSIHLLL